MVRPQAAALSVASSTAGLPEVIVIGKTTAAIGACAACTAAYAFTMPLPHWPDAGQEHWSEPSAVSKAGHTGKLPVFGGNAVAVASMRAAICAGVKLPLTERIRAAMPDTMGAAKLVPRLGFNSLV